MVRPVILSHVSCLPLFSGSHIFLAVIVWRCWSRIQKCGDKPTLLACHLASVSLQTRFSLCRWYVYAALEHAVLNM